MAKRRSNRDRTHDGRNFPTQPDVGRGTFSTARARNRIAARQPQHVYKPKTTTAPTSMRSEPATVEPSPRKVAPLPSRRKTPDPKKGLTTRKERPTCKAKPKSRRGSGNSRNFVPWCKK